MYSRFLATTAIALAVGACAAVPPNAAEGPRLSAYFDCVAERGVAVSAHRSQSSYDHPENSVAAILATGAAIPGAILEMDVIATRDGHLILMHDETLDRTTTGQGRVADQTLEAIQRARLVTPNGGATDAAPPTLAQALEAVKRVGAIASIDLKAPDDAATLALARQVIAVVRASRAQDHVVLITYSGPMARAVSEAAPEMMISAGIADPSDLDGLDPRQILAWTGTRQPRPDLWAALRARGVEPQFGTLGAAGRRLDDVFAADGDPSEYLALVEQGVAIVATSTPLVAAQVLREPLAAAATCAR